MDKSKFPEERIPLEGEAGHQLFPQLGDNFEVLGPSTSDYNCIAHSLGKKDLWVNPQTGSADAPFARMDEKYRDSGFYRSDEMCLEQEPEISRIVLYATKSAEGHIQKITHAALQEPDGTWSSKLGQGPLFATLPQKLSTALFSVKPWQFI